MPFLSEPFPPLPVMPSRIGPQAFPTGPLACFAGVGVSRRVLMPLRAVGFGSVVIPNDAASHVFNVADRFQVIRVYTSRVAAKVVDLKAVGDRSFVEFVHKAVRALFAKKPVSFAIAGARPFPAAGRPLFNKAHGPFYGRRSIWAAMHQRGIERLTPQFARVVTLAKALAITWFAATINGTFFHRSISSVMRRTMNRSEAVSTPVTGHTSLSPLTWPPALSASALYG